MHLAYLCADEGGRTTFLLFGELGERRIRTTALAVPLAGAAGLGHQQDCDDMYHGSALRMASCLTRAAAAYKDKTDRSLPTLASWGCRASVRSGSLGLHVNRAGLGVLAAEKRPPALHDASGILAAYQSTRTAVGRIPRTRATDAPSFFHC